MGGHLISVLCFRAVLILNLSGNYTVVPTGCPPPCKPDVDNDGLLMWNPVIVGDPFMKTTTLVYFVTNFIILRMVSFALLTRFRLFSSLSMSCWKM